MTQNAIGWLVAAAFAGLSLVVAATLLATRARGRRQRAGYARLRSRVLRDTVALLRGDGAVPEPELLARLARYPQPMLVEVLTSALAAVEVPPGTSYRVARRLGIADRLELDLVAAAPERRAAAADSVGDLGLTAMMPALFSTMRDSEPAVRLAAARAYARLSPDRCAPALLRMLRGETGPSQTAVAELVAHLGAAAGPALVQHLAEQGRTPLLVSLLAHVGDTRVALPALAEALGSPDPLVRKAAADGLGRTGSSLAVPALIEATGDPEPPVRAAAAASLGVLGFPETIAALVSLLDDPEWSVRHRAAQAVGSMPGGLATLAHVAAGAPKFVVTAASTVLQQKLVSTGLLADLVGDDPARRYDVERMLAVLAEEAGYRKLIVDLGRRYPDPVVRARLAELFDWLAETPGEPVPTGS